MKRKIIIFGNTKFSELLADYIKKFTENEMVAFTVDRKYITTSTLAGYPVFPFENINELYNSNDYSIMLGLGYAQMNNIRKSKYLEIKQKGYKVQSFIHPTATIEANNIGEGNIILEKAFIGPNSVIGNCNIFWNGCNVSHNAHIDNYNYFSPSTTLAGRVSVNNNCFFGVSSTIANDVNIASYTLVGATAYISKNTDDYSTYVPARTIKLKHSSMKMEIN